MSASNLRGFLNLFALLSFFGAIGGCLLGASVSSAPLAIATFASSFAGVIIFASLAAILDLLIVIDQKINATQTQTLGLYPKLDELRAISTTLQAAVQAQEQKLAALHALVTALLQREVTH